MPNGTSLERGSHYQDPFGRLPLDPPIGLYRWPTRNPRIFMPPWYPLVIVWYEPTNKIPYWKLQYLTYVKDINPNVHIKVIKKVIRANGEIVEANIINLFGFILQDILEWGESHFVMAFFLSFFDIVASFIPSLLYYNHATLGLYKKVLLPKLSKGETKNVFLLLIYGAYIQLCRGPSLE